MTLLRWWPLRTPSFLLRLLFWEKHTAMIHLWVWKESECNSASSHRTAALCPTASLQTLQWPCGFPPALSLPLPLHPWSPSPVCEWKTLLTASEETTWPWIKRVFSLIMKAWHSCLRCLGFYFDSPPKLTGELKGHFVDVSEHHWYFILAVFCSNTGNSSWISSKKKKQCSRFLCNSSNGET